MIATGIGEVSGNLQHLGLVNNPYTLVDHVTVLTNAADIEAGVVVRPAAAATSSLWTSVLLGEEGSRIRQSRFGHGAVRVKALSFLMPMSNTSMST